MSLGVGYAVHRGACFSVRATHQEPPSEQQSCGFSSDSYSDAAGYLEPTGQALPPTPLMLQLLAGRQ